MVGIIGLGFVGLTTGLGFAGKGVKVYGFDSDNRKLQLISKCDVPFHEPHLPDVLQNTINKEFIICNSLEQVIRHSKIIFYCVGTPTIEKKGADLGILLKAIADSLTIIKKYRTDEYKVLVIKSTVPPNTTWHKVKDLVVQSGLKVGKEIGLANNPEFLREGCAWEDFTIPDRIVLGVEDGLSKALLLELYKPFHAPVHLMSYTEAEFVKYLSNTLLATMISFANEMSMLAHHLGRIDIRSVFQVLHQDKRWFGAPAPMSSYVYPGCGFGGYCLPKDLEALYQHASHSGYKANLLEAVAAINRDIKTFVIERIEATVRKEELIGILGLSFKPNSDDVRETPAKDIIQSLLARGFEKIIAHDPLSIENFKEEFHLPIKYANDISEIIRKASCIVILTGWEQYKNIKKDDLTSKKVMDFRFIL